MSRAILCVLWCAAGLWISACASTRSPGAVDDDGWSTVSALDGVAVSYRVAGAEHGDPTIVFVHGFGGDTSLYDDAIAHMAARFRVIAIDLPGHGRSGAGRVNWTIEAYGEDVRAVCDAEHAERVVLVGHSMGGPVILEATRALFGRVLALVPVETFHDVDQRPDEAQIERILDLWRRDFTGSADAMVRGSFHQPIRDPDLVERVAAKVRALEPEVGLALLDAMFRYDPTPVLDTTTLPIRALNSGDRTTDVRAGRQHAKRFDVRTIPNVGHYPMLEDPEVFAALLDAAMDELAR